MPDPASSTHSTDSIATSNPVPVTEADEGVFELGLVMAGAVSAGAYAAGAVDFLVEALEAWEAAKADDYAVERAADSEFEAPRHRISIKALSGASAGSMCSALAALTFASEFEPCRDVDAPPPPNRNRLFDAWVERIDLGDLLRADDLQSGASLVSVLDSTVLERILREALEVTPRERPAYVDPGLAVFLSVTNLRGIPYGFRLAGGAREYVHGMTAHKDYMAFQFDWGGPYLQDAIRLNASEIAAAQEDWWLFGRSALASGAFPVGLAPRKLERPARHYDDREWTVPSDVPLARNPDGSWWCDCTRDEPQAPNWPATIDPSEDYEFWCVDGGVMDNEPLELARRYLARNGRNPRDPFQSNRAVIMIDPFPNRASIPPFRESDAAIEKTVPNMFFGLIRQARFKPSELFLAQDDDVGSRFVIAPARKKTFDDGRRRHVEPAIASGILGAFGGFLARAFRAHDYALGRRNCQRFLTHHFVLPVGNETVFKRRVGPDQVQKQIHGDTVTCQPIIPLFRGARDEATAYRPVGSADFDMVRDDLRLRIKRRSDAVVRAVTRGRLGPLLRPLVRWIGARIARREVLKAFDGAVDKGLAELDASFDSPRPRHTA